jgi:hypothetical protein
MPLGRRCKSRGGSFGNLYRWLQGNDFLSIKKNRQDPLIIMNARKLASLLAHIPRQTNTEPKEQRKQSPQQETPNQLAVTTRQS